MCLLGGHPSKRSFEYACYIVNAKLVAVSAFELEPEKDVSMDSLEWAKQISIALIRESKPVIRSQWLRPDGLRFVIEAPDGQLWRRMRGSVEIGVHEMCLAALMKERDEAHAALISSRIDGECSEQRISALNVEVAAKNEEIAYLKACLANLPRTSDVNELLAARDARIAELDTRLALMAKETDSDKKPAPKPKPFPALSSI